MLKKNQNFKYGKFLRSFLILFNDLFIMNLCLFISYYLRLEYFLNFDNIKNVALISSFLYLILYFLFNINNQYFRYFSPSSSQLYLKIYLIFTFLFGIFVVSQNQNFIPKSLILIFPLLFFVILIINRILITRFFKFKLSLNQKKAIVFGFNSSNINLLSSYVKILCFIDNKKINSKRIINGIKILSTYEFNDSHSKYDYDLILIENESLFNNCRFNIRNYIFHNKILVQKVVTNKNEIVTKSYFDFNYFFNRRNKITPLGKIYENKVILITGAGGS